MGIWYNKVHLFLFYLTHFRGALGKNFFLGELKTRKLLLKLSDLCQIVSGTGVIRKFHEFLKSHFWGDFDVWPNCAPPPPRTAVTAAWRAAQLSWPRPQVSALSHPSSGARGTHWLLQSAFWLLLLTAEAATRVLDRVSELEGFYIDANDGFRYEIARGFEIEEKIGLAQRKYLGYVFHFCEPPLSSVFCDNYLPKCLVDSGLLSQEGYVYWKKSVFLTTLFIFLTKKSMY